MDFETETLNRLRNIELKLDFLLSKMGYSENDAADYLQSKMGLPEEGTSDFFRSDNDLADVVELARRNRKIEAIKLYREKTGASLRDAKGFVDNLSY